MEPLGSLCKRRGESSCNRTTERGSGLCDRVHQRRVSLLDWGQRLSTNRALVYTIESARNLCGGLGSIDTAIRLQEMALAEAKQAKPDYEGER